ncbi:MULTISPECIES: GIY-YIG nuclease family protein [Empedobacter]|uniref:GIY-YIG nuclease family protein n=1 Tax=Empedobacter TaxID=59734 RepID=UPI0025B892F8|nr:MULTISPECIES: GIY-YIG nuclease family protein [unclassified Empedobacter]
MRTAEVLKLIEQFSQTYRNSDLEKFEIGEKYVLYPKEGEETEFSWPNQWQFCGDSGIYLFIDENDEVIYIGETTHFGNRFGSYFSSKIENLLKHNWNSNPHFVIPIKVPTESSFERLGLEEYLIKKTNPIDNKRFNN